MDSDAYAVDDNGNAIPGYSATAPTSSTPSGPIGTATFDPGDGSPLKTVSAVRRNAEDTGYIYTNDAGKPAFVGDALVKNFTPANTNVNPDTSAGQVSSLSMPQPIQNNNPIHLGVDKDYAEDQLTKAAEIDASDYYGETYDPHGDGVPFGLALNLGRQVGRGNFPDAGNLFSQSYPNGILKKIIQPSEYLGGDDVMSLLYKTNKDDPDEPFKNVGQVWSDIGAAANLRNLGMFAASAAVPEAKGIIPLLKAAGAVGFGTQAGNLADYGVDTISGIPQTQGTVRELDKGLTGGIEAAGGTLVAGGAMSAIAKIPAVTRFLYGVGRSAVAAGADQLGVGTIASDKYSWLAKLASKYQNPDLIALSQEAKARGMPELTIGQTGGPLIQRITGQISATSNALSNVKLQQLDAVRDNLQRAIDNNPSLAANTQALDGLIDAQKNEIAATAPLITNPVGQSLAGDTLQKSMMTVDDNVRKITRIKANNLQKLASGQAITLDTAPLIDAAKNVDKGIWAPGLERDQDWNPVLDDNGNPLNTEPTKLGGPTPVIKPFIAQIKKIGEQLSNITVGGQRYNAMEQLMELRDGLYDLMTNPRMDGTTQRQAYKLWDGTVQMMKDGVSAEYSKIAAPERFQQAAADFFQTYGDAEDTRSLISGILNAKDPGSLATALFRPGRLKTINTVKSSLLGTSQADTWGTLVDGYRQSLLNDMNGAGSKIKKFQSADPDSLNAIISPQEQKSWIDMSTATKSIDSSLIAQKARGTDSDIENAMGLAQKGNLSDISTFISRGGDDAAASIRGAVFKDILDQATVTEGSKGTSINPEKLSQAIRQYSTGSRAEALAPVMRAGDQSFLDFLGRYADVLRGKTDSYGSLRGGAMASKLYDVAGAIEAPGMVLRNLLKLVQTDRMGRVLAQPAGQNMVRAITQVPGGIRNPLTVNLMARVAGYAAQLNGRPQEEGQ